MTSRTRRVFFFSLFKGNSPTDLFFIRDIKLCSTARTTKSTISKWANYKKKASIESTKFAQQNLWSTFQLFKVPKKPYLFLDSSYTLRTLPMPAARPLIDLWSQIKWPRWPRRSQPFKAISISGAVGSTVLYASVICLSIHIFIYTAIKKLRKPPAQNLLALTCALCPGQLLLVLALSNNTSHSICIATATFLHYFFLVAAFWMNVLHFDLCRVCFKRCFLNKVSSTAREASRAKFRFKLYSYYAWGIPILLVTSGHVSGNFQALDNYNPHYATNYCWINGKNGLAMYLALPMATLLLENGLFIAVTVICLLQNHRQVYIQGI